MGTFKSGLKGGVHICKVDDAPRLAEQMLGQTLVTKQTGPAGKPVNTLYIASKLNLVNEMYFAILLDRVTAGPMLIACSEGATLPSHQIEDRGPYLVAIAMCNADARIAQYAYVLRDWPSALVGV